MFITRVNGESVEKRKLKRKNCTFEDINMLVEFQDLVMENIDKKDTWGGLDYTDLIKLINNNEHIELYYDKDVFVGFAVLILNNKKVLKEYKTGIFRSNEIAIYCGVMISPVYWGNGLQRQLTKRLEKKAKEEGRKNIVATVSPDNLHSYDNFIALGYKVIGEKILSKGYRYLIGKELVSRKTMKYADDIPA